MSRPRRPRHTFQSAWNATAAAAFAESGVTGSQVEAVLSLFAKHANLDGPLRLAPHLSVTVEALAEYLYSSDVSFHENENYSPTWAKLPSDDRSLYLHSANRALQYLRHFPAITLSPRAAAPETK